MNNLEFGMKCRRSSNILMRMAGEAAVRRERKKADRVEQMLKDHCFEGMEEALQSVYEQIVAAFPRE